MEIRGSWTESSSRSRVTGSIFLRAVKQNGDLIDILVQSRRNQRAAEYIFRKLLKGRGAVILQYEGFSATVF